MGLLQRVFGHWKSPCLAGHAKVRLALISELTVKKQIFNFILIA